MGQKVHPHILRIGINKNWRSLWFADRKNYMKNVLEDNKIRRFIFKKFVHAAVAYVVIERLAEQLKIKIASARPGVIIGRRGADIDKLKEELGKITDREISVDIIEIKIPMINAQLIGQNIAFQIEKRVAFRRAAKRSIDQALQAGVKGIKIRLAGRLGGAEMARTETYHVGSLPLQTFRAAVDYGFAEARTTYGIIGIKVWVFAGQDIVARDRPPRRK